MDPLSDLLRVIRLDGAYFYSVKAAGPWGVEARSAQQLLPHILPGAEHLISYHIVTKGQCFGGLVGEEMVELNPGDVIVFPHGDPHIMASHPGMKSVPREPGSVPARYPGTVHLGAGGPETTAILCGFLGCDLRPFNPLLASLPHRMHMRGLSNTWLGSFTRQVIEESQALRAGAETVLTRLAELMFIEVIRQYLDDMGPNQTGWLAGLRDEVVGKALTLLHARPGHPWTLVELTREVSASRSKLVERFTELMGEPPMQYLTRWRMQVAAKLLVESGAKVSAVGAEVGYESEAAFSRAFKKATGTAPGAWRSRRRATLP
jgi:AraC-like DNA-binding protein